MQSLAAATGTHVFWIASRAAGILALLLASSSVAIGLLQGSRRVRRRLGELRSVHEALSLATIAAIAVHGLVLVGDGFIKVGLADVTIPFVSSYQRLWTTAGIVSGWAVIVLGLSYYARARIGAARWRTLHRFTALAWLLAIVHSLGEGTDAGTAWFLIGVSIVTLPALGLLVFRTLAGTTQPVRQPQPREVTS
jgi:sulfoxide reductase heme-binding subunit YedZ